MFFNSTPGPNYFLQEETMDSTIEETMDSTIDPPDTDKEVEVSKINFKEDIQEIPLTVSVQKPPLLLTGPMALFIENCSQVS